MSETLLALVAALIAVIGGAAAYWNQKRVDRAHSLAIEKRELYAKFVNELVKLDTNSYASNVSQLALICPDEVVRKMIDFSEYAAATSDGETVRDMSKFKELLAAAIIEMRKDVFGGTSLEIKEMKRALPINE